MRLLPTSVAIAPAVVHEMWEACCASSVGLGDDGADEDCGRLLQILRNSAAAPPVGVKRTRDWTPGEGE
jgi:hypothetical protein